MLCRGPRQPSSAVGVRVAPPPAAANPGCRPPPTLSQIRCAQRRASLPPGCVWPSWRDWLRRRGPRCGPHLALSAGTRGRKHAHRHRQRVWLSRRAVQQRLPTHRCLRRIAPAHQWLLQRRRPSYRRWPAWPPLARASSTRKRGHTPRTRPSRELPGVSYDQVVYLALVVVATGPGATRRLVA